MEAGRHASICICTESGISDLLLRTRRILQSADDAARQKSDTYSQVDRVCEWASQASLLPTQCSIEAM